MMISRMLILSTLTCCMSAQTFTSGSTGGDGDLTFPNATSGSTVVFDPNDKTLFPNGVNPAHDNVFNFGKIIVPAGVHVVLRSDKLGGPVYFLAIGDVQINGWLDLDGNNGVPPGYGAQTYAVPGPGGFYGGGGGDNANRPPTAGFGPQGGVPWMANGNGKCSGYGSYGGFSGNTFLVPLVGGSGGGGWVSSPPQIGSGGGAGGGAILIASSGTITIAGTGSVTARGGNGGDTGAGPGAGGAIRLVANTIAGSGSLLVTGGSNNCTGTVAGEVRLEAFTQSFGGQIQGASASASPFATFVPTSASPSVKVITVNGVAVNANPSGSFSTPDVTINAGTAVPVVIQTNNIPATATVSLQVFSDNGASQTIPVTIPSGAGTSTQITVQVQFPSGFSRGFLRASFTE